MDLTTETYLEVLKAAGYDSEPTEENVREMFSDYVDSGVFADVDLDEIEDIPTEDICKWFLRGKKKTL